MAQTKSLADVSLVVITLNEADTIERCLASAAGAGEIIVVDSFSTDGTVEAAKRHGARVLEREFVSAADQKNYAVSLAARPWVLLLDADEELTPELRQEIADAVAAPRADGYSLRRRSEFFGARIRFCGWGRDRVLRLFRRGAGRFPEVAVHEHLVVEGKTARLVHPIEHRPYRDLADYIERMESYSRRGALELKKKGRPWFPGIVTHPTARFIRMYVLQLGFLDGGPGFVLCALAATSVFFKYAALREFASAKGGSPGGAP
jgi:glycosyltransferase involved in cell wall biosynthesis